MEKIYLCLPGRIRRFIKLMMVVLVFSEQTYSQVSGDFRSTGNSNWNTSTAWERYNGNIWEASGVGANNPGQLPNFSSAVYIQSGHTISLIENAICGNLNIANSNTATNSSSLLGRINLSTFTLAIHGKLRSYYGAVNSIPGITDADFSVYPFSGTTGKISIEGNSRTLVATNEWGVTVSNPSNGFFPLEINLNSGHTVDIYESITVSKFILNTGTFNTGINRIALDNGNADQGDAFINTNGILVSAASNSGLNSIFSRTGNSVAGTLNVNGKIILSGTSPQVQFTAINFNEGSIIEMNKMGAQNFLGSDPLQHPGAVSIPNYQNLILNGSNNKTPPNNFTVLNDITISGSAVFNLGSLNVTVGGNWVNYNTTGFTESTSNIIFNGAGTQSINTIAGEDFYKLNKTGSGTLTLNSDVRFAGTSSELNISSGTLDASTNRLSGTASTLFKMSAGTLKLAKLATTLPEFLNSSYTLTGGTIELNGSGAQVLRGGQNYRNLTFSGFTSTTLLSNPTTITGTVYITGSALLDIGASNNFGSSSTNLTMDGGRLKMSGSSSDKPDIDGLYNLSGGIIEFAGSSGGTQPIKGKTPLGGNIIYKNIEVTGTNVGTGVYNIYLNQTGGNFIVKGPNGIYAPNTKSIISENNINTSSVTIENGGTFKIGNNKGFSGTSYSVIANSAIDNNIESFRIFLNANSTVDYAGISAQTISNQIPYQNFSISATSSVNKTAPGITGGDLIILGNITKGTGATFVHNSGTVSLEGKSAQIYSCTDVGMEFYTLVNKNISGSGFIVNSNLGVVNQLKLEAVSGNATKLTFGSGNINLRSSSVQTASIPDLGTLDLPVINYTGTGRFQIERYLFQKKAWRLLATPVDIGGSPSITNSWREDGVNISNGYGTQITGPSSSVGMDTITQRGSLKWFDQSLNNYREITNTGVTIAKREGYFVFVRGDRAQTPTGMGSATNLRIRGKILSGTQPDFNIMAGNFASIGNPYASAIDLRNVTKTGGIVNGFTAWNPISSLQNYGVGGFETYLYNNTTSHYERVPLGSGVTKDTIQSGEAIFMQAIGTNGKVIFEENDKVNGSKLESRNTNNIGRINVLTPTLEINLFSKSFTAEDNLSDGVRIDFGDNYNDSIDNYDARKINNSTDNLSIKHDIYNLIVERRNLLSTVDSIFLSLSNTRLAPYRLEIDPSVLHNLPLKAYLIDKFLQKETLVSLNNTTNINFIITNDAGSKAADRFMIVFRAANLPDHMTGNFITLEVEKNSDKSHTIKWSYKNEQNITHYSIERSNNGIIFTGIGNRNATNLNTTSSYNFTNHLSGIETVYYRVKATLVGGEVQYSEVKKIINSIARPLMTVSPNPVENKNMHIDLEGLQGSFNLQLVDNKGVIVFTTKLRISPEQKEINILLGNTIAAGIYDIRLLDKEDKVLIQTVFIR